MPLNISDTNLKSFSFFQLFIYLLVLEFIQTVAKRYLTEVGTTTFVRVIPNPFQHKYKFLIHKLKKKMAEKITASYAC